MDKIEAKFQIVTPMFIGGANQQGTPQLSAKAIKSAILFWWRALNYSESKKLSELYECERKLFGGSNPIKDKGKIRENSISPIRFKLSNPKIKSKGKGVKSAPYECSYLAYGTDFKPNPNKKEKVYREHLTGEFTLELISKSKIEKSVIEALQIFGLLGGLGAKSLKGFGSVTLLEINRGEDDLYKSSSEVKGYFKALEALIGSIDNVSVSSVSSVKHCKMVGLPLQKNAEDVLKHYNENFSDYRREEFEKDSRWFFGGKVDSEFHPKRAHFGLPHSYFNRPNLHGSVESNSFKRRESPLRMHVHRISEQQYIGVLLYFKSDFLPKGHSSLKLKRPRKRDENPLYRHTDRYEVINNFMDWERLNGKTIYDDGKWFATGDAA